MGHDIPLLVLTVINPIVYAVATIFNALSGDTGVKLGKFYLILHFFSTQLQLCNLYLLHLADDNCA